MKIAIVVLTVLFPLSILARTNPQSTPPPSKENIQEMQVMTPELLWKLGRVSAVSTSPDGETFLYRVSKTDIVTEGSNTEYFFVNLNTNQTHKTDILKDKSFIQWDKNGRSEERRVGKECRPR